MSRRIVQELTEQQSLILRQSAGRVMEAQAVVDYEDAIYKALLGMVFPGGDAAFDPAYGLGVFYIEEEEDNPGGIVDSIRLMDDDEVETDHEGDPHNARIEGGPFLDDGDEG